MRDLISRQAAIKAFYIQSDDDGWWVGTAQDAETLLNGLPTINPVKWIPVSERLPNQNERFLVQYEDGQMDVAGCSDVNPFWTNLKTDWHWVGTAQFAEVVAWMPLPEPWRGQ